MMTPTNLELAVRTVWVPLSGGFWGMIDEAGGKWRAVEMPEELRKADLRLKIVAQPTTGGVSIFMWGKEITLLKYEILPQ